MYAYRNTRNTIVIQIIKPSPIFSRIEIEKGRISKNTVSPLDEHSCSDVILIQ